MIEQIGETAALTCWKWMRRKLSQDVKVALTNEARKTYSTLKDYETVAHLEPSGTCLELAKDISGTTCSCPHAVWLHFSLLECHPTFK